MSKISYLCNVIRNIVLTIKNSKVMNNYSVYVRGTKNNLWWVKTFYSSNYKDNRGAYKAANRHAKKLHEKTGNNYLVIEDE